MGRSAAIYGLFAAAILILSTTSASAETSFKEMFTDPADGAFDMSRFIKSRTGFVPIVAPVTEPAVGYGAAGGLIFFHRGIGEPPPEPAPAGEGRMIPPSLTAVGGFATENGSWGVFGGHRGVWKGDRIRYLGGMGYATLQLTFYGTTPQTSDISRDIEIRTVPFLQDLGVRIPGGDFFAGLRYAFVSSDITFKPGRNLPGVTDGEWTGNSKIGGLIPYLEYDSRDNFFTPSRGIHAKASLGFFDGIFGGDYDYRELRAKAVGYWPVLPNVVAGLRADGQFVAGDAPFYALPFVQLRGIPAMRYPGNRRADARNGGAVDGHAAVGPCRVRGDREGGGRIRGPSGCGDRVERRRRVPLSHRPGVRPADGDRRRTGAGAVGHLRRLRELLELTRPR
jgi:hypothetical protein